LSCTVKTPTAEIALTRVDSFFKQPRSSGLVNPLASEAFRGIIDAIIENGPFLSVLFTECRRHNNKLEQVIKVIRHHHITPPCRQRIDTWTANMLTTLRGMAVQSIYDLKTSAFVVPEGEDEFYSEWNKSGIQWTPEMRSMGRKMNQAYLGLGRARCQRVQVMLPELDDYVSLSDANISRTFSGCRNFWRDPKELRMWQQFLDLWARPDLSARLDGL
jgi:hypothetical protein